MKYKAGDMFQDQGGFKTRLVYYGGQLSCWLLVAKNTSEVEGVSEESETADEFISRLSGEWHGWHGLKQIGEHQWNLVDDTVLSRKVKQSAALIRLALDQLESSP